jgi:deazaflavin-dependent oxidoreductase (nitroreductase family)
VTEDFKMSHAPAIVRMSNPLTSRLLRLGLPMGPNILMTVRGRKSGEPRSAPVAVVETEGRRFVIGAYGDVQWVRNLRAAEEADFALHGGTVHLRARELDQSEAIDFYGNTLRSFIGRLPWFGRAFAKLFFGAIGPEFLNDPAAAAAGHPVFELTPG